MFANFFSNIWTVTIAGGIIVGITILLITRYLSKMDNKKTAKEPSSPSKSQVQSNVVANRNPKKIPNTPSRNPRSIIDHVRSQPPYLKRQIEKTYEGLKITWGLGFNSILSESKKGVVDLATVWDDSYPWVYFEASLAQYPEIKSIHAGTIITVSGVIKSVDGHTIYLEKGAKLAF